MKKRKVYPKELRARVALEAIKENKTIAELSSEYEVHSNMISKWKKHLQDKGFTMDDERLKNPNISVYLPYLRLKASLFRCFIFYGGHS